MFKFLLFLGFVAISNGQQCKEMATAMDQFLTQDDCLKETGVQSLKEVTPDKYDCYTKCVYTKRGILDDQGKAMKDGVGGALAVEMPEEAKKNVGKKIETCLEEHGGKIKADDCMSYKSFCECAGNAFKEEPCKTRRRR